MLIRTVPKPAPSPADEPISQHVVPAAYQVANVVPANDTIDALADVDLDALFAEREPTPAVESPAPVEPEPLMNSDAPDEPGLPVIRPAACVEEAAPTTPAVAHSATDQRGGAMALLSALAVVVAFLGILSISGPAGRPAAAIDRAHAPSDRSFASASVVPPAPVKAEVSPIIAPPVERVAPPPAAPAIDSAPIESADDPPEALVAETPTPGDNEPVPEDTINNIEALPPPVPVETPVERPDDAIAVDPAPASLEVSKPAPRPRKHPARLPARKKPAVVAPSITPTSRDLPDEPVLAPASDPE